MSTFKIVVIAVIVAGAAYLILVGLAQHFSGVEAIGGAG
jgi:hypothetical protein